MCRADVAGAMEALSWKGPCCVWGLMPATLHSYTSGLEGEITGESTQQFSGQTTATDGRTDGNIEICLRG